MLGTRIFGICALLCLSRAREVREDALRQTLPAYTLALNADLLNSTTCRKELEDFREAVDHRILWSLRMLDSSGEPKPGFIYGNNYWLGSRSQCLDSGNRNPLVIVDSERVNNSRYRDPNEEFPPFALNYFVAHFRHNSTLQYHVRLPEEDLVTLGLCLPASCSTSELGVILKRIFRDRTLLISDLYSADFRLIEVRDLQDDHQWLISGRVIIIGLVLVLTWGFMLIGTLYDVIVYQKYLKEKKMICYENNNTTTGIDGRLKRTVENTEEARVMLHRPSRTGKILQCFSIYTNTKIIFNTKLGPESVPDVHGLRFLGMVWIVMIHTIFYMSDYADNKTWAWRMAEGFAVQVISNSTLSVDTFFFLSGFLVAYLYFNGRKLKEDRKPVNYGRKLGEFLVTVLRRFIRLTPAYILTLGIVELNSAWYGETSLFYMTEQPQEVCPKYWWRNILYINNLFGRKTMCMSWSWYLSNDMQFFIIGSFLLILSSVFFYTAVFLLFFLLIGSILFTGYVSYINGYVPTMDEQYNMLDVLYDPPWTRIGPYIVGIITAYVVIKLKNQLHAKKRTIAIYWCIGSSCNVFVLFGLWERHISVLSAAFYVALSRTVWAVGLAWLIIACCTKHGGIIHKILSFRGWVPLSRLTYCAYLLNPVLINSVYLHSESAAHVDFLPNGALFLGNFAISYFCAYMLTLMAETPYVLLMRQLLNRKKT